MKKVIWRRAIGLAVWTLACGAAAQTTESYVAAKLTDMARNVEYKVMTADEFKTLENEVKREAALFSKAEELAKKDWKADDGNKHAPFPGSRVNPRKAEAVERTTVRERADKRAEAGNKAEDRKNEPKKTTSKPSEAEKKRQTEEIAKERDAIKGAELLKAKLAELMAKEKEPK